MGKFVPSPLTNLPGTNQTNKDSGSHWTQSLKVRTSKQHNSSILQTNQETREKLNFKQKSSQTRSKIPNVIGAQLSLACTR